VVDDSGTGALAPWLQQRHPRVQVHGRPDNGGFARALGEGIARARHGIVFAMNSDLRVRPGFLEPLVATLQDPSVFAAAPCVLQRPAREAPAPPAAVESLVRVELDGGLARVRQPCLEDPPLPPAPGARPLPFALGGACLLRKQAFLELGGFDPLFAPFYMEDVDLCWRAWRAGLRVVHVPDAVVEHLGQATIHGRAGRSRAQAAIARNTLLFQWKHLDGARELEAHVRALEERAARAFLLEERDELAALALALEALPGALAARKALPPSVMGFAEIARASDPFGASETRRPPSAAAP
jgi:GT2 family glycosyltransferase